MQKGLVLVLAGAFRCGGMGWVAMSTFSLVGSRSSNGMRMCVCVCMCVCGRNELEVCTTLVYPQISSFRAMPVLYTQAHTHTHTSSNHLRTANRRG